MSQHIDFLTWWRETHQSQSSAEQMWESWQAPHRAMILVALSCLPDVISLYEVGCGSGPNLRLLQKHRHWLALGGSEPCPGMAVFASEQLGILIDQTALPDGPTTTWDVILSCYTMAYLDPEALRDTLATLHAGGHHYLILMEPMGHGELGQRGQALPEWYHDYLPVLRATGWTLVWRWPIIPSVDGMNGLLVVERE